MSDATKPYEYLPGPETSPLIFLCDHASNAVPSGYGTLGLDPVQFDRHIAWDIGAGDLTRALAADFNAPAFLGIWSRLLIDLNRGPEDPTLVMKLSDGAIIPGNATADDAEIASRLARFHAPYHSALKAAIDARVSQGISPALISMHSFTPVWRTTPRPWHVGILWDRDDRISTPLIKAFQAMPGLVVGDNEPYTGALEGDTLWTHGTSRGLPHVLIEIRQDLISDPDGVARTARLVTDALHAALAEAGLPR
jgi:predicted N-formylglutamate amidohydrolase